MKEVKFTIRMPEVVYQSIVWAFLFYRRMRYGEAFRIIPLSRGLVAIVSPADYDRLAIYKWYANKRDNTWYACRFERSKNDPKKQKRISMHREILCPPDDLYVDHRNHNGLDERRTNLRAATEAENGYNKRKTSAKCTSQYKGVHWWKLELKWRVQGRIKGKQQVIGYFDNEVEAAKAYDGWAKAAFGEFANLNFPGKQTDPLGDWSFKICYGKYSAAKPQSRE